MMSNYLTCYLTLVTCYFKEKGDRMKKKYLCLAVICILSGTAIRAQERQSIELVTGQQRVVEVDSPQRIAIGNESVADVFLTSNRKQVLVTGKGIGTTDLVIWDKDGNKETRRITVWEKDPKSTADELKQLLGDIDGIQVKVAGPNVIIEGELFKQPDLYRYNQITKTYPNVIDLVRVNPKLRQMVEIDVKIVEIDEELINDLNPIPLSASYEFLSPPPGSLYSVTTGIDFSQLNIWIKEGKAKLLAKPRLVVASGEEASFFAGGEIPFQVSQGSLGGVTTEWKKYGVSLNVKPGIDKSGNINLVLKAEFSNPDWASASGGVPGVLTRSAQTNLLLQKGETAIIAGLLQKTVSRSTRRVPVLGYIPVINWFFSGSYTQIKDTELLIFVTPYLPAAISVSDYRKISADETRSDTGAGRGK